MAKETNSKQITIFGSFSGRNKGDLAILRSMLIQIKQQSRAQLTVYLFTKDTIKIQQYLQDIITEKTTANRFNIKISRSFTSYIGPKTIPALAICDKVIIGGGGLFFDNRLFDISFSHILNIFIITLWLKLFRKDTMIYAVGCSHLDSKLARWMTKIILNNAKIVSTRDELSRRIFSKCTNKKSIVLGGDPVFLLKPKTNSRADNIIESWPKNRKILLALHKHIFFRKETSENEKVLKQFSNYINEFAKNNSYSVLTYTNHTDQRFASRIAELCEKPVKTMLQGENHLLPEELIYLFSKIDLVIATQMHVCIFAYLAKVPLLSLIYDDKVMEFNQQIGNKNYLHLTEISNRQKVEKAIINTANSKSIPHNPSVYANSKKLADLLNEFVWS